MRKFKLAPRSAPTAATLLAAAFASAACRFMARKSVAFAASLLLLGGVVSAHAATLVVNGGFETGDFTGWTTGANSYPQSIVSSPVHSGQYAAQIAGYESNPDTLSQTITTAPGQSYELSFWRDQILSGPPITLIVTWNGTTVFSELNPSSPGYQNFTANVVGTGSDSLVFTSANDNAYTYLDDVSLTPTPLPAALPLFAGGLGMIGLLARRRKRKDAASPAAA